MVAAAAADGSAAASRTSAAAASAGMEGRRSLEDAKVRVLEAWQKLPKAFPNALLVSGEPMAVP